MRTVVTHFDGDPFVTEFWLRLYKKYWRGEIHKIYADLAYDPAFVPERIVNYQKELFAEYPEIDITFNPHKQIPEISNNELIKKVEGDYLMFAESDGFVFRTGVVDSCFKAIESGGYDLCSARFPIIPYELRPQLETEGHMRCFMFVKKDLIDKVEFDLMPRHLNRGTKIKGFTDALGIEVDTDCFGWVSIQLASLKPKTLWTEANLCEPDFWDKSARYDEYSWIHVRQMNSSVLGFGCKFFKGLAEKDKRIIKEVKLAYSGGFGAEWQYIKACAFRLLMLETMPKEEKEKIGSYYDEYKAVILYVIKLLKVDEKKIQEMKGYYKGLMKI